MGEGGTVSEARHAAVLRWLEAGEVTEVTVSCAEAALTGGLVLDRCLSATPLAWLAELALHAHVRLAVDACAAQEATRSHVGELARLTSRVTLDGGATAGTQVRYTSPPARRRGLFGLGHTAPGPAGTHQQRLAAALAQLPVDPAAPSPALRLRATDACTSCGVCVRSCPHDALILEIADGTATLAQRLDVCEGEEACVALCPHDALHAEGTVPWPEVHAVPVVELISQPVRVCAACQAHFSSPEPGPLCPVCRQQEADPFAVHLPPAARALLEHRRRGRAQD